MGTMWNLGNSYPNNTERDFFFPILNNLIKRTLFHCNSNSKYNLQYLQWFLIVYWLMIRKFWTRCRKKLFTWFVVVFKFCYCLLVRFLFVWFFVFVYLCVCKGIGGSKIAVCKVVYPELGLFLLRMIRKRRLYFLSDNKTISCDFIWCK